MSKPGRQIVIHSLSAKSFLVLLPLPVGGAASFGSFFALEVLEIPVGLEPALGFSVRGLRALVEGAIGGL